MARAETKETVQMRTSTGAVQPYQKYSRFKFTVDGQEAELTIYSGEYGYFLPFVDALAGSETSGAAVPGARARRRGQIPGRFRSGVQPVLRLQPEVFVPHSTTPKLPACPDQSWREGVSRRGQ